MLSPASRAQPDFFALILGLAPQALCCRPLRGLNLFFAGLILGLAPQALCCRPLRGLNLIFLL